MSTGSRHIGFSSHGSRGLCSRGSAALEVVARRLCSHAVRALQLWLAGSRGGTLQLRLVGSVATARGLCSCGSRGSRAQALQPPLSSCSRRRRLCSCGSLALYLWTREGSRARALQLLSRALQPRSRALVAAACGLQSAGSVAAAHGLCSCGFKGSRARAL